jgi:hypothetical protein
MIPVKAWASAVFLFCAAGLLAEGDPVFEGAASLDAVALGGLLYPRVENLAPSPDGGVMTMVSGFDAVTGVSRLVMARLLPSGRMAWLVNLADGAFSGRLAVDSEGQAYVSIFLRTGVRLEKRRGADGALLAWQDGAPGYKLAVSRSPAGRKLYVSGYTYDRTILKLQPMTVCLDADTFAEERRMSEDVFAAVGEDLSVGVDAAGRVYLGFVVPDSAGAEGRVARYAPGLTGKDWESSIGGSFSGPIAEGVGLHMTGMRGQSDPRGGYFVYYYDPSSATQKLRRVSESGAFGSAATMPPSADRDLLSVLEKRLS